MKKFYTFVSLSEKPHSGYHLLLDKKPVKTPARQDFFVRSLNIAQLIVQEWMNQGKEIIPSSMPISQMAMTLIDRVVPHRHNLEKEILDYINTDLIFYRANEPEQYKIAQEIQWDPFIAWFDKKFGFLPEITTGLSPITQADEIHSAISQYISAISDEKFMALYLSTLGTGSIILGLAFIDGHSSPEEILSAAFAEEKLKDEIYLGSIYGAAPDQEKKYKSLKTELETLCHFLI